MKNLDWTKFENLEGDPRENWELLCREVVRRHYDQFGSLLTRRQQPGVEFHLELIKEGSELGQAGEKWGWQCKWYASDHLTRDGSLRADQRKAIEGSIEKSHRHVQDLSDWVLWTREPLTAGDLRWFEALEAPFTLRHWDGQTLAGLLSGPAEPLRSTWFGELVLDVRTLRERRREALSPIRQRYVEELHLRTDSESEIEGLLLGPAFEEELESMREEVRYAIEELEVFSADASQEGVAELHHRTAKAMGDLERSIDVFQARSRLLVPAPAEVMAILSHAKEVEALLEKLAASVDHRRHSALLIREVITVMRDSQGFLQRLAAALRTPLMIVLGGAGAGKTHLAANISGPDENPRGLLVLGRQFGAEIADDDLARYAGLSTNRDELLEALEAIGLRERRRVPLVIDGLNESEDPGAWQTALARLGARLGALEHVVGVVTLRPTYRRLALPSDLPSVELDGFIGIEREAVERYFLYYRIDASPQTLSWWRPSDPLLLSIFCRTVNPDRERVVRATELPASLAEVLETYLDGVCEQIARTMKIPQEEIEDSLLQLGWRFYREGTRELGREEVSETLGDRRRAQWKESLRFQLEAEEILIRDVVEEREMVMWSYDLLAGHVIARKLLGHHDPASLGSEAARAELAQHPLREDIVTGLVGLLGPRGAELLDAFQDDADLCFDVLQANLYLPPDQVGKRLLQELPRLFEERPEDVLEAVERAAFRPGHPLNARVLDRLLRNLPVWRRDLIWTDWFQRRSGAEPTALRASEAWRLGKQTADDEATMVWLSWVLTSPDQSFRHAVIQALYRLGKQNPKLLFERALQMLSVNDPSVGEGVLAATYGVVMASQLPSDETREAILELATDLCTRLGGEDASEPTAHWLVREYAYRIMQFGAWISDGEFEAPSVADQSPLPLPAGAIPTLDPKSSLWNTIRYKVETTLGEDMEKVLGKDYREREERVNSHREIFGRVVELGWEKDRFERVERERSSDELSPSSTIGWGDSYAAKYALIGHYELGGRCCALDEPRDTWRLIDPPLDPSFSASARAPGAELPGWHLDISRWLESGDTETEWLKQPFDEGLDELLYGDLFGDSRWVAIDGEVAIMDPHRRRRFEISVRGMLALDGWGSIEAHFTDHDDEAPFPRVPVDRAFAGESPWSPTFDAESTSVEGVVVPWVFELSDVGSGARIELLSVLQEMTNRSIFNTAEIGHLPAKFFASHLNLRKLPDLPEFVDEDGRAAVRPISFRGWKGAQGHLLYVREELLNRYLHHRHGEWGWHLTLKRTLLPLDPEAPASIDDHQSTQLLSLADLLPSSPS